jgi:hypothetical protein
MNLIELNRALGQLRLGGIPAVLETRLRQAQAETMTPIDFLSCLVSDELTALQLRYTDSRAAQTLWREPEQALVQKDHCELRESARELKSKLSRVPCGSRNPVRELRNVLRKIRYIHARKLVPSRKDTNPFKALAQAS